jgi:hypothetical protein
VLVRCSHDRTGADGGYGRQGNILRRIPIEKVFHEYEVIAFRHFVVKRSHGTKVIFVTMTKLTARGCTRGASAERERII